MGTKRIDLFIDSRKLQYVENIRKDENAIIEKRNFICEAMCAVIDELICTPNYEKQKQERLRLCLSLLQEHEEWMTELSRKE